MPDTKLYDIAEVSINEANYMVVRNSLEVKNALSIYDEVDKLIIRSVALPPSNANSGASIKNQALTRLSSAGSELIVYSDLANMVAYKSDDAGQGIGKWVGLLINTGVSDITKLTYNGSPLTSTDVKEATQAGGSAGDIILWIKAEVVAKTPKTITLAGTGYTTKSIKIKVVDTKGN